MQTDFNLDDYKGDYVMHCATEEEANNFLEILHRAGRKWCSGDSYLNNYYDEYKNQTCYEFNAGAYCYFQWYKEKGYTILEWSDFMEDKTPKIEGGIRMTKIYTHDEAAQIIELFESVLCNYGIKIPSPEDDERETDNEAPLYGSVYSELLDDVEAHLVNLLDRHNSSDVIITDEFSGMY